jgi:squalene-hopene/tetraprenyl-beta-curcumene cyclase
MRKIIVLVLALLAVLFLMKRMMDATRSAPKPAPVATAPAKAGGPSGDVNPVPLAPSLRVEGEEALARGLKWLVAQQQPAGHWSNPDFPALTGLAVWALAQADLGYDDQVARAVAYMLTCVHPDGSIYREPSEERKGGGLPNYNTAICMVALHAVGNPELTPVIQAARAYVAGSQHFGDDDYEGGMGYDPETGRPYADLSNSYLAYEAMRLTEAVEDLRAQGAEYADLDWEAAVRFIERVQNRPESNDQAWASDDEQERGGFVYKPDSSQAGSYTNAEGVVRLRSYGSMTYAGLLSFIYADVDPDDPRVQSALEWSRTFWSLDENPGMGAQGLFYYYNTLAKALAVYGQDILELSDGTRVSWKAELIRKLVSLQKIEPATGGGFWVNDEGRWWESDPVLASCYALLALEAALGS